MRSSKSNLNIQTPCHPNGNHHHAWVPFIFKRPDWQRALKGPPFRKLRFYLSLTGPGGNEKLDPHFEITNLSENTDGEAFTFDFHGEDDKAYCMISDVRLQVSWSAFLAS